MNLASTQPQMGMQPQAVTKFQTPRPMVNPWNGLTTPTTPPANPNAPGTPGATSNGTSPTVNPNAPPGTPGSPGNQNGKGWSDPHIQNPDGTYTPGFGPNTATTGGGNQLIGQTAVQYGGQVGGANAAAQGFGNLAQGAQGAAAPTIVNPYQPGDRASSLAALNQIGQTAAGGGPGQQAVQGQFDQNLGQNVQAQLALANSTRGGGPAVAAAQGAAAGNAAQAVGQSAQAAGTARAQMALGAQGQYSTAAGNLANQDEAAATAQAQMQFNQNQLNQQGALGYYGLGQAAEQSQLGADQGVYANNLGLQGTAMQVGAQQQAAAISGGTALAGLGVATLAAL